MSIITQYDNQLLTYLSWLVISSVQLLSHVQLFTTSWTIERQASLSLNNSQSLLKLMSNKLVMPPDCLILCRPLLPPSIFSSIRVFSNESVLPIRSPKYWRFSFSTSLPGLSTTPRAYSNSCPSSQWYHPTLSFSVVPFSSRLQSFPAQGLFQWVSSLHQVAKVLEFQLQHQSFQWIFRTDFL